MIKGKMAACLRGAATAKAGLGCNAALIKLNKGNMLPHKGSLREMGFMDLPAACLPVGRVGGTPRVFGFISALLDTGCFWSQNLY